MLRRYLSGQGESFSRRVGYDFKVEISKSNRAQCRSCKKKIPKDVVRFALMMQDEEGYKSAHWQHEDCFWRHGDVATHLNGLHELHGLGSLNTQQKKDIRTRYCQLRGIEQDENGSDDDDDDDDDDEDGNNKQKNGTSIADWNGMIAKGLYRKAAQVRKEKPRSTYAGKAWSKAAKIIKMYPVKIKSGKEAVNLKGIGKKIGEEIESILESMRRDETVVKEESNNEEVNVTVSTSARTLTPDPTPSTITSSNVKEENEPVVTQEEDDDGDDVGDAKEADEKPNIKKENEGNDIPATRPNKRKASTGTATVLSTCTTNSPRSKRRRAYGHRRSERVRK